jgi:hypothetical protein
VQLITAQVPSRATLAKPLLALRLWWYAEAI